MGIDSKRVRFALLVTWAVFSLVPAQPVLAQDPGAGSVQGARPNEQIRGKLERVQAGMRDLAAAGVSPKPVRGEIEAARDAMQAGDTAGAEAALDRALQQIEELRANAPSSGTRSAPDSRGRTPRQGTVGAGTLAAKRGAEPSRPVSGETIEGRLVWGDIDDRGRQQIFIVSGSEKERRQLTQDEGGNWMPAISPDGARVAYVHRKGRDMEIRLIDAAGGESRVLAEGGSGILSMAPAWSPDGSRIAYAHRSCAPGSGRGCKTHIWVMDADGGNKRQLTSGSEGDNVPTWSPDGKHIAFTSAREGGRGQVWVIEADGSNPKRLTKSYYDETLKAYIEQKVPAWSPDGSTIAYWQGVEMDDQRTTGEVPRDIWVMDADGRNPRFLVSGDGPAWSPDGSTVIFPVNRPSERNREPLGIGAIAADGSNFRVLLYCNGFFGRASWGR